MNNNIFQQDYETISTEITEQIKYAIMLIKTIDKIEFYNINLELDVLNINLNIVKEILDHNNFLFSQNSKKQEINHKLYVFYDYFLYIFKILREKYEEVDLFYFTMDEENVYLEIIKTLINTKKIEISQITLIFMKIYLYWLKKIIDRISALTKNDVNVDKIKKKVNRIRILSRAAIKYLSAGNDYSASSNKIIINVKKI